jgi:hypothetical protein
MMMTAAVVLIATPVVVTTVVIIAAVVVSPVIIMAAWMVMAPVVITSTIPVGVPYEPDGQYGVVAITRVTIVVDRNDTGREPHPCGRENDNEKCFWSFHDGSWLLRPPRHQGYQFLSVASQAQTPAPASAGAGSFKKKCRAAGASAQRHRRTSNFKLQNQTQ